MAPHLPAQGRIVSQFSEGGALYALGIIHAGHGHAITDFLCESLRDSRNEATQHGACLGLGLVAQGTDDDTIYDTLKGAARVLVLMRGVVLARVPLPLKVSALHACGARCMLARCTHAHL